MALQKLKTLFGNDFAYHKIIGFETNLLTGKIHVKLGVYKDKAHRDLNDKDFAQIETVILNLSSMPEELYNSAFTQFYSDIKASKLDEEGAETNYFADAIDV